jgi:acyl-CoA synthetase (AMP-forming)/AMP-acid ligase II
MIQQLTLSKMLEQQAKINPDHVVFRFEKRGSKKDDSITYAQLHARAVSIAKSIQSQVSQGDRIFLLYQPGLEFIAALFACFYLGAVPIPAYPPNPKKLKTSIERLNVVIEDSQPVLILTSSLINTVIKSISLKDSIQKKFNKHSQAMDLGDIPIINTQKINKAEGMDFHVYEGALDDTALLLYTSGSTGHPKGIAVSHKNVVSNVEFQKRHMDKAGATDHETEVIWLPHQHSLCLIGFILRPIYTPTTIVLFSPLDFLADPIYWLKLISQYKAFQSIAPNFALDFTAEHCDPKHMKGVDLSCLRALGTGGASVSWHTLENFEKTFKSYGLVNAEIFPCYGLSEAVVGVTGYRTGPQVNMIHKDELNLELSGKFKDIELNNHIVSNGAWPKDLSTLYIVNPENHEVLSDKVIGEIWVKNKCIAKGYWNKPEATKETFEAYTADGQGPFLRTGDVGFISNDELYIVERIKDLIIIRGKNFIPNDIEQEIMKADDRLFLGSVAFSYQDENDERLVVASELDKKHFKDKEKIKKTIEQKILEIFDVKPDDIVIVEKGGLPRTVSGKIQRQRYKKEYVANRDSKHVGEKEQISDKLEHEPTQAPLPVDIELVSDDALLTLILDLLKKSDAPPESLLKLSQGEDVLFSEIGFDSLKLMQFYSALLDSCGIEMTSDMLSGESELFMFDKSVFDTMHSVQSVSNKQGIFKSRNHSEKTTVVEPEFDAHPDLVASNPVKDMSQLKTKGIAPWLERRVLTSITTVKKSNPKKYMPLEKYARVNIKQYVQRYLSSDIAEYAADIQEVLDAIIHQASLYDDYAQSKSGLRISIEAWVKQKLFQNGVDNNQYLADHFKHNEASKIIYFMHTPLDFAAAFTLIKTLDDAGIKTGVITREAEYENIAKTFGLEHCVIWNANIKRATFGLEKMVKEKRLILMVPDSFFSIYTNNACRFNVSEMFPQKQAYVKNRILNDLLHKDLFMYLGEFHEITKHFKLPIVPISGTLNHGHLQIGLGDEVLAPVIVNGDYSPFLKEVLQSKMPHFIDQFPLFMQVQQAIQYYAGASQVW